MGSPTTHTTGTMRQVIRVKRGPIKKSANGVTCHDWAFIELSCGHTQMRQDLKQPRRNPPKRARCEKC